MLVHYAMTVLCYLFLHLQTHIIPEDHDTKKEECEFQLKINSFSVLLGYNYAFEWCYF